METAGTIYIDIVADYAMAKSSEIRVEEDPTVFTGTNFVINNDGSGDQCSIVRRNAASKNKLVYPGEYESSKSNS